MATTMRQLRRIRCLTHFHFDEILQARHHVRLMSLNTYRQPKLSLSPLEPHANHHPTSASTSATSPRSERRQRPIPNKSVVRMWKGEDAFAYYHKVKDFVHSEKRAEIAEVYHRLKSWDLQQLKISGLAMLRLKASPRKSFYRGDPVIRFRSVDSNQLPFHRFGQGTCSSLAHSMNSDNAYSTITCKLPGDTVMISSFDPLQRIEGKGVIIQINSDFVDVSIRESPDGSSQGLSSMGMRTTVEKKTWRIDRYGPIID